MDLSGSRFNAFMRRLPDPVLFAMGLAMIVGISALELTPSRDVPIVDFLLVAVVGVGWFARRRRWGYALAVIAAVASVATPSIEDSHIPVEAAVASGAARLALYLVLLALLGVMRHERTENRRKALTDQTSGAANARAFHGLALSEIQRARRYGHDLSLAYLDVDDFKGINDRLGHVEGDRVLREVSHVMRCVVRSVDTVARVGGDEFVILMPETDAESARAVVDRVRAQLARLSTADGRPVPCSIGLVTFDRAPASLQEFINAGDDLMYRAKLNGKDRVEQAERPRAGRVLVGRS